MHTILKFKIGRRYYKKLDFVIIIALIMICLFSLANIFSATHSVSHSHYLLQQSLWIALICFVMAFSVIFIGGVNLKIFSIGLALLLGMVPLVWNSNLIKDYQKSRLTSFLNQNNDILGNEYQLQQSKIAIGSGGTFGKGYLQGTQISGGSLPESSTDFIFAVVGEEWGLSVCRNWYGISFKCKYEKTEVHILNNYYKIPALNLKDMFISSSNRNDFVTFCRIL